MPKLCPGVLMYKQQACYWGGMSEYVVDLLVENVVSNPSFTNRKTFLVQRKLMAMKRPCSVLNTIKIIHKTPAADVLLVILAMNASAHGIPIIKASFKFIIAVHVLPFPLALAPSLFALAINTHVAINAMTSNKVNNASGERKKTTNPIIELIQQKCWP